MANVAAAFDLSEEDNKALQAQREDEIKNPIPDEAPPANDSMEGGNEAPERPRNPDGTFAPKVEAKAEEPKKDAPEAPAKPAEAKSEPEHKGYVPHGALHEEREKRKALQAQMEKMEQRFAEIQAKLTPQTPPPDPNQDFPGHVQHHFNQFSQKLEGVGKQVQDFDAWRQQQAQEQQFRQAYYLAAQDFSGRQADFPKAYQSLVQGRMSELLEAGYTQQEATHIQQAEERAVVARAFEAGVNPCERLYAVAKRRGYTVSSAEPQKPAVDPVQKLETIERGQRATPSMAGGQQKAKLTLQSVSQMSDEEFNSLNWEKVMRELTP